MQVLVTAGGTQNPIDDVRVIGNLSTGNFGCQIALAFLRAGCQVTLLHSRRALRPDRLELDLDQDLDEQWRRLCIRAGEWDQLRSRYRGETFETVQSYGEQLRNLAETIEPDVVVLAAAVSDYVPVAVSGKISSKPATLTLQLERTPKYISMVKDWTPDVFLVGFKLLSGASEAELIQAARESLTANRADLVVANDLQSLARGNHTIHLVRTGIPVETYESADSPAQRLVERIIEWSGKGTT